MAELPKTLSLEVATPLGKQLSLETESVQVPSVAGEFGVLPGHVPLLAALKPGILRYRDGGKTVRAAVGGGYVEATSGRVRLITEYFARPQDVKLEKAQADRAAAEEQLKQTKATIEDVEFQEAQTNLDWALARIELITSEAN